MAGIVARVVTIFGASRGDCLGHGSSGIVFTVNPKIVVKTASRYDTHPPGYAEEEQYSLRRIKEESAVFDILAEPKNWHPNIILSFLHTPEYIFMERAREDLFDHVIRNSPISLRATYRLLSEIVNAVSWLEQLGILHGDVRPPNILISHEGHVKLCDFDNTCSLGQYIQVANVPYYEQLKNGSFGIAEARMEQGAIGCCAYFISTGTLPEDRSHDTGQIPVFGHIIRKCWNGQYQSVRALGKDILAGMSQEISDVCHTAGNQASLMSVGCYEERVAECRQYLSLNGIPSPPTSADLLFPPTKAMMTKN
ncbi:hypothetical protein MMC24_001999 [Lignoscripta atroalba]|nr:hypothetical protein [Lignoscripta atroalba]